MYFCLEKKDYCLSLLIPVKFIYIKKKKDKISILFFRCKSLEEFKLEQ